MTLLSKQNLFDSNFPGAAHIAHGCASRVLSPYDPL
jgi:hypothetical protein